MQLLPKPPTKSVLAPRLGAFAGTEQLREQLTEQSTISSGLPDRCPPLRQSVTVTFDYDVHFTFDLFDPKNPLLAMVLNGRQHRSAKAMPKSMIVAIDAGLVQAMPELLDRIRIYADYYSDLINLKAEPLVITGGEGIKNDPNCVTEVQQLIHDAGICRHSYVLAIGGGALLDMVGYAAATAHRGIRLVRVPTTVLSQDDSGVGVKNSVNAFGKKNFLGTFTPPYAVINDAAFLVNLPQRDWIGGIAEAIKVALIKDAYFFAWIEANAQALVDRDLSVMQQLIYRSCQHHLTHIGTYGDPFEMGSSRPLDFGHWSAHRLEHLTNYRLRHGEAVAIGMALDSTYAYLKGDLAQDDWQAIIQVLQTLGFTLWVPELSAFADQPNHPQSVFRGLSEFREHLGGELTLMLLDEIGYGFEVHEVDISVYQQAIEILARL
jgi:3-dehydroquinate synthase